MPSTKRRQRLKLAKRQRQRERKREAFITASLPAHLGLLAEQARLMAELKQTARMDSHDSITSSNT